MMKKQQQTQKNMLVELRGVLNSIKTTLDITWYDMLMKLTETLEIIFTSLLDFTSNNKDNFIFRKLDEIIENQYIFLKMERIYYTKNLIYTFVWMIVCSKFKSFVWMFVALKLYGILMLPKKTFHRIGLECIYNSILGIPLIIATTMNTGVVISTLSFILYMFHMSKCNPRSYEKKYLYCFNNHEKREQFMSTYN